MLSGQGGVSVGSYVLCNSNTTAISNTKLRLYVKILKRLIRYWYRIKGMLKSTKRFRFIISFQGHALMLNLLVGHRIMLYLIETVHYMLFQIQKALSDQLLLTFIRKQELSLSSLVFRSHILWFGHRKASIGHSWVGQIYLIQYSSKKSEKHNTLCIKRMKAHIIYSTNHSLISKT